MSGKGRGKNTGQPLSPAELEQRRGAGRAGYLAYVKKVIESRPDDLDGCAAQISMFLRHRGMKVNGLTRKYIEKMIVELEIVL